MASKMDFESLIDTPRKQAMLGISIAFMIVFPLYFQEAHRNGRYDHDPPEELP